MTPRPHDLRVYTTAFYLRRLNYGELRFMGSFDWPTVAHEARPHDPTTSCPHDSRLMTHDLPLAFRPI